MRAPWKTFWTPLLAVCLTGCTAALPKPDLTGFPCEPEKECTDIEGNAVLSIDADGNAKPPCAKVWNYDNVTWIGAEGAGIELLDIQFKIQDGIVNPGPPLCSGPLCFLSSSEMPKEGAGPEIAKGEEILHCYAVVVRTKDGRTKVVDPKLIIKY